MTSQSTNSSLENCHIMECIPAPVDRSGDFSVHVPNEYTHRVLGVALRLLLLLCVKPE